MDNLLKKSKFSMKEMGKFTWRKHLKLGEKMKNKWLVYCFKMVNVSGKKIANLPEIMEQ